MSQFGTPLTTTDFALCIYDESGGSASLVQVATAPGGGTCGGSPCWKPLGSGYRYKNSAASDDGVQQILLKGGQGGKAKVKFKAGGLKLQVPAPAGGGQFFAQDPAVTVQLVNDAGFCFGATFSAPAQRNETDFFNDKSD